MTDETTQQQSIPNQLLEWFRVAVSAGASDIHLVPGNPPVMRVHGSLHAITDQSLEHQTLEPVLRSACPNKLLERFDEDQDVDFSLETTIADAQRRFRMNYFVTDQEVGACVRIIPEKIPDFDWSGFPRVTADRLVRFRNGMVLVTGVAGAGKTTTLAMLVNLLNMEGNHRVITIEEPVEYRYPRQHGSVVSQREVGLDVRSFAEGLKHGLRQDPDVILIGEIRDRETAQMALTAAETGHLVLSTLHTRDAKGAVSRYADLFPQSVQDEIRSQLALCLRAVVSQHLLPALSTDESGFETDKAAPEKRHLALEIMFNNSPIQAAIRTGKLHSIDNYILTGRDEGMQTLNDSVTRLLNRGRISRQTASRFTEGTGLY